MLVSWTYNLRLTPTLLVKVKSESTIKKMNEFLLATLNIRGIRIIMAINQRVPGKTRATNAVNPNNK